jgi:hypothetical protein
MGNNDVRFARRVRATIGAAAGLALLAAAAATGCASRIGAQTTETAPAADQNPAASSRPQQEAPPVVQTPATRDAAAMQNAFAEVAQAAEPAVVTITTESRLPTPTRGRRLNPFGDSSPFGGGEGDDPFEEFFRRFGRSASSPTRWIGPIQRRPAGSGTLRAAAVPVAAAWARGSSTTRAA